MASTIPTRASEVSKHGEEEGGVPFYPNHLLKEVIVAYAAFGVLLLLVALFPPHLGLKADPFTTPEHIKPEWYFLSMYQFLKLFPQEMPVLSSIPIIRIFLGEGRTFSIMMQGVGMLVLVFIPFIDRSPERSPRRRPLVMAVAILVVLAALGLGILGRIS